MDFKYHKTCRLKYHVLPKLVSTVLMRSHRKISGLYATTAFLFMDKTINSDWSGN